MVIGKKRIGFIILLFFTCQFVIDCLNSVTAFPFLHFGMFSGSFEKIDIETFEIKVNDKVLTANQFSILKWDLMHSALATYSKQITSADFSFDKKVLEHGMQRVGFNSLHKFIEPNLNNVDLELRFPDWYKRYLEKLIDNKIESLVVHQERYNYVNGKYQLVYKSKWIEL